MWGLVQRWTGRVGYRRTVKAEGLAAAPPVIDCSGWVGLLLVEAMHAENEAAGRPVFADADAAAVRAWSDRIISEIETRTGFIIAGAEITPGNLPRCATVGVRLGSPEWATNHPRSRAITHIAQIVRRPQDDAALVSESIGLGDRPGIRLMPVVEWLAFMRARVGTEGLWAVDAFGLAANGSRDPLFDDCSPTLCRKSEPGQ